ncbi:MAG TPA: energy transducer TonB [Steroidobacteraceae bacterium]|nr:energy transducer TonB [Steroidobacteraceae bacterium]
MASAESRPSHSPAAATPVNAATPPAGVKPSVDITALTSRDEFLLELGQALAGEASIRPVDSVEAAIDALTAHSRRGQVLVVDALQAGEVRPAVDAAQSRAPHAVVLVFAPNALERQVAASVKGSKVFAVLPSSPIDPRKTHAIFTAVIDEAAARKKAAAPPVLAAAPPAELELEPIDTTSATLEVLGLRAPPQRTLLIAGAGVAVAALAVGAWLLFRGGGSGAAGGPPAPTPAAQPQSVPPAAVPAAPEAALAPAPAPSADLTIVHGKVDELLEKARAAMRERHYTEPSGDNALLYYRSAAAADPTSGEARDGLGRVANVITGRFEESLNAGRLEQAGQDLANLRAAVPEEPRIPELTALLANAQIAKAISDGSPERATALLRQAQQSGALTAEQLGKLRADLARRQQEDTRIQHLAGLVEDRIRDGKLLDPADDSAKYYVRQLVTAAPSSQSTQRAQHDLGAAYVRKAREAALARNSAESDRWLNEARAAGVPAADISAMQHDLVGARAKAAQAEGDRLAQLVRDRMRDGRLTEPAQDSAAYYLTQLQSSDAEHSALLPLGRELAAKLLDRARAAVQAGRSADQDLGTARRLGADPKDILAVQQLAAPKAAADMAALAARLKLVKSAPPDYPKSALQQSVAGSVLLSFTVDTRGETRDVQVLQSTPAGVFDRAAVSAVKRWKYAPVLVNGAPVEVPVRTLVRFELPKQ